MGAIQPFFLEPGPGRGQRFCIFHAARGEPKGRVLHLHPFAEEMNKSRRMAALQSHALAAAGFAVLQIDLLGCGDSSGDFGDAGWQDWLDDLLAANHLLSRKADGPLWLWGQRVGCLLASELAPRLDEPCNFLFWQPPAAGKSMLQQFLRLKLAAGLLDGSSGGAMDALKKQLADGETVEVAGYRLSAALADGLEHATLRAPARAARAAWFEMKTQPDGEVSPALESAAQRWRAAGVEVNTQAILGPAFWQTSEIEDAPQLLAATLAALQTEVRA